MPDFMDAFRRGIDEQMKRGRASPSADSLSSSLGEFMAAHYADLMPMLTNPQLDWERAAAFFARQGYGDSDGRPPTAECARETWQRVEAHRRAGVKLRKGN